MSQLVLETLSRRVETKQNRPKRVADNLVVFTALTVGKCFPDELGAISQVFECIRFNQASSYHSGPKNTRTLEFTRDDAIKRRIVVQASQNHDGDSYLHM